MRDCFLWSKRLPRVFSASQYFAGRYESNAYSRLRWGAHFVQPDRDRHASTSAGEGAVFWVADRTITDLGHHDVGRL